jgi:hypothetical protein
MRAAFACLALLIAFALLGYLAIGWGAVIWQQGFEAAITDRTTQPSLPATVACAVLGAVFLGAGISLLGRRPPR